MCFVYLSCHHYSVLNLLLGITSAPELPATPILVMWQTHLSEESVCLVGIYHSLQALVTSAHIQDLKSHREKVFYNMAKQTVLERFPQRIPLADNKQQPRMHNAWGLPQTLGLSWRFSNRTRSLPQSAIKHQLIRQADVQCFEDTLGLDFLGFCS